MKTIWSSYGELDKLLDMSAEDKRRELTNWYDSEMIDQLADDQLDEYISDNQAIYDEAANDFEYRIAPMIANQFMAGLILDDGFNLVDPATLLDFDGYSAELDEYDDGLYFDVEGRKKFPILGFSDDQAKFIDQLDKLDILGTIHNLYPNWDDEDIEIYDIADLIPFDWTLLEDVLDHAVNNLEIEEELTEAKAKDSTKLSRELDEIRDLADEYGYEYFTQMPFTAYDNDPISIEMQYPEFFRIVKAFFKEMGILEGNDVNNTDLLDMSWDQDISKHDWDVLMRACDKLVQGKGVQFEKEYKTGYNSVLDDDEILANREQEESLNEDGISVFNGEYEVGKAYTSNTDLYMADDFRDLIFSEDEENEARQLGMIQDDESLIIPAHTKMVYVGDGGGGWPEFRVGKFLDFDIVDSNDEGYILYPINESLNDDVDEDMKPRWPKEIDRGYDFPEEDDDEVLILPPDADDDWDGDLVEDTETWPWGDPDSALPRKDEVDKDSSAIDKFL